MHEWVYFPLKSLKIMLNIFKKILIHPSIFFKTGFIYTGLERGGWRLLHSTRALGHPG